MLRNIINANSALVGKIDIGDNFVLILNGSKPALFIIDPNIINLIKCGDRAAIPVLYDDYTLTVAEIAALYNTRYFKMAEYLHDLDLKSPMKAGRRNSSYSLEFSKERRQHMHESSIGKPKPKSPDYVVPVDLRKRISETLKEGYRTGRIVIDREKLSKAWKDGKYKDAKMVRGIQGYFYSKKIEKDVYFRSLLELRYLIAIENNPDIKTYQMEPFCIPLSNNHHYTPDLLIDNELVVEIKPRAHLQYTSPERFALEMEGLQKYCIDNGLNYDIWYDDDIGFASHKFRQYLKLNPDVIKKYNIRFKKAL